VNVSISISDPGVSLKHAEFRFDGKNLTFVALDHTAESYVNGKAVNKCVLLPGDRIQVGTVATLKYTV
jgi:pSer/pThr/pTyr-binding forkhead associated (FHA) protein